jgi:Raf kinase inhibitor-like YbhB/YbcL family protein
VQPPRTSLFTSCVSIALVAIALAAYGCGGDDDDTASPASPTTTTTADTGGSSSTVLPTDFTLTSSAFADNQPIPKTYTCDGDNSEPPLEWSGAPDNAQQLALIVDDPDAPSGSFVHWVIYGFGPDDGATQAGQAPPGATEGKNGANGDGYIGPCPPSGVHHYKFQLFALSAAPDVQPGVNAQGLRDAIADITLATTTLTGTYTRG